MQAIWMALTVSGTTPYIVVSDLSQAPAALDVFIRQLWYSLNGRFLSILMPSQRVAFPVNRTKPSPTLIFAANFGWKCFLWPYLHVNNAAYLDCYSYWVTAALCDFHGYCIGVVAAIQLY